MELNEEMADPEYWSNPDKAQVKNKELKQLEDGIKEYESLSLIHICPAFQRKLSDQLQLE